MTRKRTPKLPPGYTLCRDLPRWGYAVEQFALANRSKYLPGPVYELAGQVALPFEVTADSHLAERAIEVAFIVIEAVWWQLLQRDESACAKRKWFRVIRSNISADAKKTEAELRRRKLAAELSRHPEIAKLYSEVHGEVRHG